MHHTPVPILQTILYDTQQFENRAVQVPNCGEQQGMANPVLDFGIDVEKLEFIGEGLQRPECILAEKDGTMWSADSRGGVVRLRHDGTQEIVTPVASLLHEVFARPGWVIGNVRALAEVAIDGFGNAFGLVHATSLATSEDETKSKCAGTGVGVAPRQGKNASTRSRRRQSPIGEYAPR